MEGMKIPEGTLMRVMQKGVQYIEFEANSEVGDDEDLRHFNALDLLTKDVGDLKREITFHAKPDSVETAKEKNNDSVKTVKAQKTNSTEAAIASGRKPEPNAKNYPVETAETPKTDSDKKKNIVRIRIVRKDKTQ